MTICHELLSLDPKVALSFALMYGSLVRQYIQHGESDNAALLASRAFHHANIVHENRG